MFQEFMLKLSAKVTVDGLRDRITTKRLTLVKNTISTTRHFSLEAKLVGSIYFVHIK